MAIDAFTADDGTSTVVRFPGDAGAQLNGYENFYWSDETVGAQPTPELGSEFSTAVSSAASTDSEAVKDAAAISGVTLTHYRWVDNGGATPVAHVTNAPTASGVDAAQPWDTDTEYTGTDNVQFSLVVPATEVNGPFVTADGQTLTVGKQYNLQYAADQTAAASVGAIADDAATAAEIALMNLVGEVPVSAPAALERETVLPTGNAFAITAERYSRLIGTGTNVVIPDLSIYNGVTQEKRGIIVNSSSSDITITNLANSNVSPIPITTLKADWVYEYRQTAASVYEMWEIGPRSGTLNTFTGLQVVGEHDQGWVDHPAGATISTGINFDLCDIIEVEVSDGTGNDHRGVSQVPADMVLGNASGGIIHWAGTSYLRVSFADAAAKTAGDLTVLEVVSQQRIGKIRGLAYAANGYVVPMATTSKTQIQVTVTGDSTTVNGGDSLGQYLEGAGTNSIVVDLPVGQSIDKTATETAINALSGVNAVVTDRINGVIEFTVADLTGNVAFPITHVPVVDGAQIFTFQQTNATLGPVTPIEGWQFNMRSDSRQIRLVNSSGNRRFFGSTANAYRESVAGGDFMVLNHIANGNTGMKDGDEVSVTNTDLSFNTGSSSSGAADGDMEYAVVECFEIDPVDRLKFVKLHTLHISAGVGAAWVDNDWRVEVIPA